jgi:hypothetical protein
MSQIVFRRTMLKDFFQGEDQVNHITSYAHKKSFTHFPSAIEVLKFPIDLFAGIILLSINFLTNLNRLIIYF